MSKETGPVCFRPSLLTVSVSVLALVLQMGELSRPVWAQGPGQTRDWAPGATAHAQRMRNYKDIDQGSQPTCDVQREVLFGESAGTARAHIVTAVAGVNRH